MSCSNSSLVNLTCPGVHSLKMISVRRAGFDCIEPSLVLFLLPLGALLLSLFTWVFLLLGSGLGLLLLLFTSLFEFVAICEGDFEIKSSRVSPFRELWTSDENLLLYWNDSHSISSKKPNKLFHRRRSWSLPCSHGTLLL